ncbi:hypothetical protein MVEN_00841300 [Mycena venus]|uniref:F-box domain-containing protein n=1 Tax=Mycena venus TaxID=2733690 RepID=A0A8H6YEZ8_9AGAR|nr:hypothetical protein MVEN_00841300 [Mycena venus]
MASPFAPRLGTNYCPTDDEIVEIKAVLVEPILRLKRLDEEIAQLQKTLDKLAEERDSLSTYVEGHKALISPVRRLPLDIIEEIFVACIPTHRNCVMSASEAPVLLGRICSSWRKISLSTPRLWAKLHIVEPSRGRFGSSNGLLDDKVAQRIDVMKMWLGRSGQCPLSISLQSGPDYDSPPITPTASHPRSGQFLQELILFAGRWQHIRFTTLAASRSTRSISFRLAVYTGSILGCSVVPGFAAFLQRGSSFNPHSLPLRWNQLTNLTVDGPPWQSSMTSEAILQTISQCGQLQTCQLVVNDAVMGAGGTPVVSGQHPPVELPILHTLWLDFGSGPGSAVTRLLEWLHLPELRDFTLHGHTDGGSMASFFGLCPRLERLSIDSNSFTKNSLLENLHALPPTMRHLTINDITHGLDVPIVASLDDEALAVLTPAPGVSICCPALETLTITYCCLISDAALLRFINARMQMADGSGAAHTAPLKRVDVQFNRRMTEDVMPSLKPFTETGGLEVLIAYLPSHSTQFSPWQGLPDAPSPWGYSGTW